MKKRILQVSALVTAILLAAITYLYFALWVPSRRLVDPDWFESATKEAIRKNSHSVLRFGIGHHDAYLWLAENGNRESVPLLIRSLKWQPEPSESGLMVCTTGHCLDALVSLTGYDAGSSYSEWKEWWNSVGSKLPVETFYPRIKSKEANAPHNPHN